MRHRFLVLGRSETLVISGIDLWIRTRFNLAPSETEPAKRAELRTPSIPLGLAVTSEEVTLEEFLKTELDKFKDISGPTNQTEHHIRLIDTRPVKQRYRPRNLAMLKIIDDEISKMLQEGL